MQCRVLTAGGREVAAEDVYGGLAAAAVQQQEQQRVHEGVHEGDVESNLHTNLLLQLSTTVLPCCSNISGNMSQPPQIYVAMCVNVLLQLQGELINFCVVSTHVTLGDKPDKATKIACKQILYLKVCIETLLVGYFRESILCFDKNSLDDVSFTVQKGCNVFCIKGCKKF